MLSGCIPPASNNAPAQNTGQSLPEDPAPIVTPPASETTPSAPQLQIPTLSQWRNGPISAGDWFYSDDVDETFAGFGASAMAPQLVLRCDKSRKVIGIARMGSTFEGSLPLLVQTGTGERQLSAQREEFGDIHFAELPAADRFLEDIAFSRGRFAVTLAGEETLRIPAYPEITRVIEDCR